MISDDNLEKKTRMKPDSVIKLFKTCVQTTYFIFNGRLYKQVDGLAIGASTSGFAAELFMQRFESRALNTFANPPSTWKRYVDDTFAKLKICDVDSFLSHLNNQHPGIKFTTEMPENDSIAFLDTRVQVEEDRTVSFGIYRKPTHTDQYLHFESHHHVKQKIGIIKTFRNRINTIITKEQDKRTEETHVKEALRNCGHPEWSLKEQKTKKIARQDDTIGRVTIPYVNRLSEQIARVMKKHRIQTAHRPIQTIASTLHTKKKDRIHDLDKAGLVYYHRCKICEEDYVGETGRCWRERQCEHRLITHKEAKVSHTFK